MTRATRLRRLINLWPPFLFAGIRVLELDREFRTALVRLRHGLLNRNYVGTHFGGSLFAMTDPFWMLLLMHRLGTGYVVWDRAAAIDFRSPGRESVYARFGLSDETVEEIRAAAAGGAAVVRWFETDVQTADGTVIAVVRKQVYVRLRPPRTAESVAVPSPAA